MHISSVISGQYGTITSLAPGRCGSNLLNMIFKLIIQISSLSTYREAAIRRMPQTLTIERLTLVKVPSHYPKQCWFISMSPYGITRPKCVDIFMVSKIDISDGWIRAEWWLNCCSYHDDVIKWKYFPRYWHFVFYLICAWINVWMNKRGAGDLRRHHVHYDVNVMTMTSMGE